MKCNILIISYKESEKIKQKVVRLTLKLFCFINQCKR